MNEEEGIYTVLRISIQFKWRVDFSAEILIRMLVMSLCLYIPSFRIGIYQCLSSVVILEFSPMLCQLQQIVKLLRIADPRAQTSWNFC
jgi:hypothetical protein